MVTTPGLKAGGALGDVTGNGRLDVVAGQKWDCHEAYWYEQPVDPRNPSETHLVNDEFQKYHDQGFGDVDGDGDTEIVAGRNIFHRSGPDGWTAERIAHLWAGRSGTTRHRGLRRRRPPGCRRQGRLGARPHRRLIQRDLTDPFTPGRSAGRGGRTARRARRVPPAPG